MIQYNNDYIDREKLLRFHKINLEILKNINWYKKKNLYTNDEKNDMFIQNVVNNVKDKQEKKFNTNLKQIDELASLMNKPSSFPYLNEIILYTEGILKK